MARNAKELFAELSELDRKEVLDRAGKSLEEEMTLRQLRRLFLGTQTALGNKIGIKQAAVSRLENRSDMHLSTLKQMIDTMGGKVKIIAQFADRPGVSVNLFDALDTPDPQPKVKKRRRRATPKTPSPDPSPPRSNRKDLEPRTQEPRHKGGGGPGADGEAPRGPVSTRPDAGRDRGHDLRLLRRPRRAHRIFRPVLARRNAPFCLSVSTRGGHHHAAAPTMSPDDRLLRRCCRALWMAWGVACPSRFCMRLRPTRPRPMDTASRMTLRIFISSPGDVPVERERAADVVRRLQEEFVHYAVLEPFFWEDQPARATETFQSQFPEASAMDIVIGVLWARIGTPLPLDKVRPDGRRYESGTVYELETAAESINARDS